MGRAGSGDDDDDEKTKGGKSRRELPAGAVATLKAWLLSPEHVTHPYPTPQDQVMLMQKTGIDKKQLKNWFTNARRRIWKPLLKKQLEQGKLHPTGAGGSVMTVPGLAGMVTPAGVAMAAPNAAAEPAAAAAGNMHAINYQQNPQPQVYDVYGNPIYAPQQQESSGQFSQQQQQQQMYGSQQQYGQQNAADSGGQMNGQAKTSKDIYKTDSHERLNALFERDQDLVRQYNEESRMKAYAAGGGPASAAGDASQQVGSQHPMKMAGQFTLGSVPSIASWPHFSSVSSLNNLGTLPGVKSITNMSSADLASRGNLNKNGNLAQVKSIENFGRADSFAFMEVFFDDHGGSNPNLAESSTQSQRGVKRDRDEDDDIGLSLDPDEPSSSNSAPKPTEPPKSSVANLGAPVPAPLPADGTDTAGTDDNGTLKRAFDDALAAKGLLSVSRSSEKLSDLAIPAKMQRTLSQEYLRRHMGSSTSFGSMFSNPMSTSQPGQQKFQSDQGASQQYPGQHPGQQQLQSQGQNAAPSSDSVSKRKSVEVPSTATCALCGCNNVDTQLRPCGHMFHTRCLKPTLKSVRGPPKCPVDHITMQSAVLAVPTEEAAQSQQVSWGSSGSLPSFQSHRPVTTEHSSAKV